MTAIHIARNICVLAAGALLAAVTPPAQATAINLIQNGSFETTTAFTTYNGTVVGTNVGNGNLPGWQVAGCGANCGFDYIVNGNLGTAGFYDQIDGHESYLYSTPGASPDGGNAFMSDGNAYTRTLYQSLTGLNVGDTYTVKFYQASMQQAGYAGASTDAWQVGFGTGSNSASQYGTAMNNPSGGSTGWVQQSLSFVANATNQTLTFFATANVGANPPFLMLDGVSMTDTTVPVPEPATIGLAAAGLLGVAAARHRRARVRSATPA